MKRVGIIGGLSPESTMSYYKGLNEGVQKRLGGHHSAPILLSSVDFGVFVELKEKGDWDTQGELLAAEARALEKAGADFVMLATNTMHKMADCIEDALTIPFLHLADATAARIQNNNIDTIGLLGTAYTMELDFYKGRLRDKGLNVVVPESDDIKIVSDIIYNELCHGHVKPESKAAYIDIIALLGDKGAKGVILGCTEITLLIDADDVNIPVFDTTKIHIQEALRFMFETDE